MTIELLKQRDFEDEDGINENSNLFEYKIDMTAWN
jgi:hypothetical protein